MKLGYVILYVPSVADTVSFYERAFGVACRFVHESGQYAEMETGATALAFASEESVSTADYGFRSNRLADRPAGAEVAFVSNDVSSNFHRAIKAGASSVLEPTAKPWGQVVSYVRDLNGFLVEICSEVTP